MCHYTNYYTKFIGHCSVGKGCTLHIYVDSIPSGQRWELDIGQRYITYLSSVLRRGELSSTNHVARVENFRNIRTFDGNSYTIPGTRALSK